MTTQVATTIEQSKRLLACGVDQETADMHWCTFLEPEPFLCLGERGVDNETGEFMYDDDIPAWSLSALMELMPISPTVCLMKEGKSVYVIGYDAGDGSNEMDNPIYGESLIEICVQMLERLVKFGFELNNEQ